MQLQIESTDEVVILQEVEYRVWRGVTHYGAEFLVLVRRIAVREDELMIEFQSDPHLQDGRLKELRVKIPFVRFDHLERI